MSEQIPTLLCDGSRIVEVCYTEWTETAPFSWTMTKGSQVGPVKGEVNRIVYELPIGCFEQRVYALDGTLTFQAGNGGDVAVPCRAPRGFAEAETIEVGEVV